MARSKLLGIAIASATAIVLLGNALTDVAIGEAPLSFEFLGWGEVILMLAGQITFAAVPMLVLAVKEDRRLPMWVAAIILTAVGWGYYGWRVWQASQSDFAGGADIGLGFAMMAAPFAILLALAAMSLLLRQFAR